MISPLGRNAFNNVGAAGVPFCAISGLLQPKLVPYRAGVKRRQTYLVGPTKPNDRALDGYANQQKSKLC
jgi:hypothetical protein